MKRSVARVAFAVLVVALYLGAGERSGLMAQGQAQGEFILRASPDRVAAIANRYGLTIVSPVDSHGHGVYLVRGPVDGGTPAPRRLTRVGRLQRGPRDDDDASLRLMNRVRSDQDIEQFHVNSGALITETVEAPDLNQSTVAILDSATDPSVAYFGSTVLASYVGQPALDVIHLPDALPIANGTGVIVAIIDTGIDPNHPALQGVLLPGYDFTRDTEGSGSEWPDLNQSTVAILDQDPGTAVDLSQLPAAFGHGTMVAGLVHVVAPGAMIMPLKAFNADGTSNVFDIERAIYYAVDHGAKVINMSFSMDSGDEITHAIDYASEHGVIAVSSVGNSGESTTVYPAAFRNVIGVASTTLSDVRSTFSNYGNHLVKFAAPGELLVTLYPGGRYASVSGTSFSSGLVTGGTALLSQLEPALDERQASRYFDDGTLKQPDWQLGDGRINLFETLRTHTSIPPPAPPDTSAPTVTLTSPAGEATVTGLFPIAADASDNVGVVGVQFALDGINVGTEILAPAPFEFTWNSVTVPNGVHALSAVARDAAGNLQTATSVSITVSNDTTAPVVSVTSPAAGATVAGTFMLAVEATDNVGVAGVQFMLDGANFGAEHTAAPYELTLNSLSLPNGIHVLAAIARDAAGNYGTGASVTVTVFNDTTAPVVALITPGEDAVVTGTTMLVASASDDVGVVGVRFLIDDVNVGAEITAAPELVWDSHDVSDGVHVLAVVARDAAGNQQTASASVIVANNVIVEN